MDDAGASGSGSEAPEPPPSHEGGRSDPRRKTWLLTTVSAVCFLGAMVIVALVVFAVVADHGDGRHRAGSRGATATSSATTSTIGALAGRAHPAPTGFPSVPIEIHDAVGHAARWCVLLADNEPRRQQGLMWVTDPGLAGYDGMLFAFAHDTTETFWMRNTPQPLNIAFFTADGRFQSALRMYPCGDRADCPLYSPNGPYRYAIEVPAGNLGRLGIGEGSRLTPLPAPPSELDRCAPRRTGS